MIYLVRLTRRAQRQLKRIPERIVTALEVWVDLVETEGLEEVRKIPGYHDEPLRGDRAGQRSVRLNIAYRAIYEIKTEADGSKLVKFVSVEEVTHHEY